MEDEKKKNKIMEYVQERANAKGNVLSLGVTDKIDELIIKAYQRALETKSGEGKHGEGGRS